ncbi:hypothetical protein PITC_024950 [Penicillium italicum]|uniref:Uncharacterized protein n=1 Tax=Penicillium italicum TaxID=40296 RepID=A0A0A2LCW9_PENIT|nr:hypothetical protein PITC_024950 [Penicillium italicum]
MRPRTDGIRPRAIAAAHCPFHFFFLTQLLRRGLSTSCFNVHYAKKPIRERLI